MLDIGCCPHCGRSLVAALTLRQILIEVATREKIPTTALLSAYRGARYVLLRQEISYRALTETFLNKRQIGRAMNRDATTITHGAERYAKLHNLPMPWK